MIRTDRTQRRLRIFAFGIVGLFAVLAFIAWWTGREDLRSGSSRIGPGDPSFAIEPVEAYEAVYRVENRAGEELNLTTERMWVRRPFDARIETWSGPPPGTSRLTVRQSVFGGLHQESPRSDPITLAVPPGVATGDLRPDPVLAEALEDDTILLRERREVFGRECQVYRFGGPVFAGDLSTYEPGIGEYADVCVDQDGLIIEEVWVRDDEQLRRRVAVEVDTDPDIVDDLFSFPGLEEPDVRFGAVARVPSEESAGLWTLDEAPDGFEQLGRYAVLFPESALPQVSQVAPVAAPTSTSDVFVRGPDVIVIDQDASLAQVTGNDSRETRGVEIDGLENAVLILDARMSEVRGKTDDGSIVRIYGTVPGQTLIELAGQLELR